MPKSDAKVLAAAVSEISEHGKVLNEHTDVITDNYRRLTALEAHITDLEERLNDRGVFSGPVLTADAWRRGIERVAGNG